MQCSTEEDKYKAGFGTHQKRNGSLCHIDAGEYFTDDDDKFIIILVANALVLQVWLIA